VIELLSEDSTVYTRTGAVSWQRVKQRLNMTTEELATVRASIIAYFKGDT
jgi:hypothetical protein